VTPLTEKRHSLPWVVLCDASGWHRAMWIQDLTPEQIVGEHAVDRADSYRKACQIADELNAVSEVQDG